MMGIVELGGILHQQGQFMLGRLGTGLLSVRPQQLGMAHSRLREQAISGYSVSATTQLRG